MNKDKHGYLLKYLVFCSGFLFLFNSYENLPFSGFTDYLKIGSQVFLILTLISAGIYLYHRTNQYFKRSVYVSFIFFVINSVLVIEAVAFEIHVAKFSKIQKQLIDCEAAKNQFQKDLENDDLKYFTIGMGMDEAYYNKLEKEYGLDVYHLGCMGLPGYMCYNELVENALNLPQ